MLGVDDVSYNPTCFDVLITDINTQDLHKVISDKLKVKYLEDSEKEYEGTIKGIIHGRFARLICTTTVCIHEKIKFVHFIVDTGSPMTYISENALNKFGLFVVNTDDLIPATINSSKASIMMSAPNSHYSEMNILGTEFLFNTQAELLIKFYDNSFTLTFPKG